jgi:phytoene dehydrogenase-like protein
MKTEFDVIIIGAGHNGLTLGAYLSRSGLSVVVLEARHEEGGGLSTEELTYPGFLHNIHANYHTFVDLAPPVSDLKIREHGVKYVKPEVQMASIYDDNTALLIYDDLDKTVDSIARFSTKDAETFRRLYKEAHGYVDLLLGTLMFEPPMSVKELTKALSVFGVSDRSEFLSVKLRRETINQFLDEHFENPKVKAHLAFHGAVCGYGNNIPGLAIGFPLLIGKINNWHISIGGSHRLAHALWRDMANHGGILVTDAEVVSIVVDNKKAVGVKLADGVEISARKCVVSTVSVEQTFLEFLDKDKVVGNDGNKLLENEFIQKVKTEIKHQSWSLFSVHLAMKQPPNYLAAEFAEDVNKAWVVNLGYGSLEELNSDWDVISKNSLPDPRPNVAVNSLYDPTDAPDGFYTGLLRQFAPYEIGNDGPAAWDKLSKYYGQKCIDAWSRFAPNIGEDAVLKWTTYSPHDIAVKLPNMVKGDWMMGQIALSNMLDQRPLPELGQYRTPIESLYMAGSTQHPHGFITFAPAYNALSVIADDLGLDKWWREV